MTSAIIIIAVLASCSIIGYAAKRVFDIIQRQSMFIMAIKNEEALTAVSNISIVEKDFNQKTRDKDIQEKEHLAASIYLSGEISDKQMKEFDIE